MIAQALKVSRLFCGQLATTLDFIPNYFDIKHTICDSIVLSERYNRNWISFG